MRLLLLLDSFALGWLFSSSSGSSSGSSTGDIQASTIVRGISISHETEFSGLKFSCDNGLKDLKLEQVNDDYCDCEDGLDEPGTSACNQGSFFCENRNYKNLIIPSSRVFDGICDCCDGTDEKDGLCENTCVQDGIDYRQEQERLTKHRAIGLKKKAEYILRASEALVNSDSEQVISTLELNVQKLETELERIKQDITFFEHEHEAKLRDIRIEKLQLKKFNETELRNLIVDLTVASHQAKTLTRLIEDALIDKGIDNVSVVVNPDGSIKQQPQEEEEEDSDDNNNKVVVEWVKKAPKEENQEVEEDNSKDLYAKKKETENLLKTKKSDLENTKNQQNHDFGPDNVFWVLHGECFTATIESYKYEMCPYGRAKQDSVNLGKWVDFEESTNYKIFKFEGGQKCWNGPSRSLQVKLICGQENQIKTVSEPSMCEYYMDFETPAAC